MGEIDEARDREKYGFGPRRETETVERAENHHDRSFRSTLCLPHSEMASWVLCDTV